MIERIAPGLQQMAAYNRSDLRGDLIAGLTGAALLVPQAMAYSLLAGLPPVYGLYASVFPLLAYALFGSSRHLAIGPAAIIAMLVYSGCSQLAEPGSARYIELATLLAVLVGGLQLLLGIMRMGFLAHFVSRAVVAGFTTGAAILICLSQLRHIMGMEIENSGRAASLIWEVGSRIGQAHPLTAALGVGSLVLLGLLQWKAPRVPGPLIAIIAGTALVYALAWGEHGVKIVGDVPHGLPVPTFPHIDLPSVKGLVPATLVIAAIGYMESMALVQLIAAREKYRVHPSVELRALGIANLVSGLFQGYAVAGSFSRTAVNYDTGARTGAAALTTGLVIIPALLFLTPLFYYLPNAVLGAIIIGAAAKLIDVRLIRSTYRVDRADGLTLVLTAMATVGLGIEPGLLTGIVCSLLVFVWRSAHPHTAELGYEPHQGMFRDVERFPHAWTDRRLLVIRVDRSVYFANTAFIEDRLRRSLATRPETKWLIVDLSGVNEVDSAAIQVLGDIFERCRAQGIEAMFAGMKGPVRDRFNRARWVDWHGEPLTYRSVRHAMEHTHVLPAKTPTSTEGADGT